MKAIESIGDIDDKHRLQAHVPEILVGPVRLITLLPDEDESSREWSHTNGTSTPAREWPSSHNECVQGVLSETILIMAGPVGTAAENTAGS